MNVGASTYAMTWNAALATRGGLMPIVDSWKSFTPEMLDGFHMAQAGQLAHLSADLRSGDLRLKSKHNEMALNNLAHACLRLDRVANGELLLDLGQKNTWDDSQSIFREIHETRTLIDEDWFQSYAERDLSEVAMPSSVEKSLELYWSVLLEKPEAIGAAIKTNPSLFQSEGRVMAGFNMALGSLVMMLPHYGAGDSALAIAREMIVFPGHLLDCNNDKQGRGARFEHAWTIVRELEKAGDPLGRAALKLRSPGGAWSLEPRRV